MNTTMNLPTRKKPEVLSPAGNLRGLKTAVDYGADAVYCGGKAFGMRSAPKNLSLEDFEEGSRYAHERGARVYVTCNVLPRNNEIEAMHEYVGQLKDTGVDALIVSDIGVMMMARQVAPNLELHVSTQAGVTNYQAANAFYELGARRVVLAREMDLQAVRDIRANIPDDLDIECFVHGAMCMAFSGRCLFSNYLTGRDGNHGECAQPCRWKYSIVEEKRPGQYFPIEQTENGAYLFNSQDMNMLGHLDDLIDSGATSLKIEGRAKSAYYIAAMTNAYKTAVNEYMIQRGFEDADGNVLKPFHDRVIRPGDPDFGQGTEDQVMRNADAAFAGVADEGYDRGSDTAVADSVTGSVAAERDRVTVADAVDSTASGTPAGTAVEPDGMSSHARSTRRKSNTAVEQIETDWKHAAVRPAPHVELPEWLLEETDKVAHRDYSTGFYYGEPGQYVASSRYIREWQIVAKVESCDENGLAVCRLNNKFRAGDALEVVGPDVRPFPITAPIMADLEGNPVEEPRTPQMKFTIQLPKAVPPMSMLRRSVDLSPK